MTLDLSSAEAKIARAMDHRRALERQLKIEVEEDGPYASRFSEVDPQTGWCDVFLVPQNIRKPRLGVIFGDVVHNLRCALDYIVTELAEASNTPLTNKHQFPIYRDKKVYKTSVGTVSASISSGPLKGIKHGLGLIEQLQPYHLKPNPRQDPLWHIHRFSNADKHRQVAAMLPIPEPGQVDIKFNGTLVEKDELERIDGWDPTREVKIARLRFDPPIARNLRTEGKIAMNVWFHTGPFRREPAHGIDLGVLRKTCDHVALVVEQFKTL
jgi:hypothetical protein